MKLRKIFGAIAGVLLSATTCLAAPPVSTTTEGTVRSALRAGYTAREVWSQSFVAVHSQVSGVAVAVSRRGIPSELVVDLLGPESDLLASATVTPPALSTMTKSPTWVEVPFSSPVPVTPGALYRVVVKAKTPNTANHYYWAVDTTNPYPDGAVAKGTAIYAKYDAFLRVYAEPFATPEPPPPPPGPTTPPQVEEGLRVVTVLGGIGYANHVITNGSKAYVSTKTGVVALDISNPVAPLEIARLQLGDCMGIATASSEHLVLGCGRVMHLVATDPLHVERTVPIGVDITAVEANATHAYVLTIKGLLFTVDLATGVITSQIGMPAWRSAGEEGGVADDAVMIEQLRTGLSRPSGYHFGLTLTDSTLVTAEWNYGRAFVWDVTIPGAPRFVSTHFASYLLDAFALDDTLYMLGAYGPHQGLFTAPIPAEGTATLHLQWLEDNRCPECVHTLLMSHYDYGGGFALSEGKAHIIFASAKGKDLRVIDISERIPREIARISLPSTTGVRNGRTMGVATKGDYIYRANGTVGLVVLSFRGLAASTPPPPPPPPTECPPDCPPPPPPPPPPSTSGAVGFGAITTGGAGHPEIVVTTLADSGPGSLREAISAGNRTITFAVSGEINTIDYLYVLGSNVTIDACAASAPGVTINGPGLIIRGIKGAHNVIIRCLRSVNSPIDGFQVAYGASKVVLDRVSSYGWNDGGIDITVDVRDVTVQRSLVFRTEDDTEPHDYCMLIKYATWRVTLYRNLLVNCTQRNPQFRWNSTKTTPADAGLQMINNIVEYDGHGAYMFGDGANCPQCPRANIESNYFQPDPRTDVAHGVILSPREKTDVWVSGNVAGNEGRIPGQSFTTSTASGPHPAPAVPTTSICEAAPGILAEVGPPHRTAEEAAAIATITLSGCGG